MEKKQYLVGVSILEARDIQSKERGNTADPFVRIYCGSLPP